MKTRLFAIIAAMSAATLAGCGSSKPATSTSGTPAASASETAAAAPSQTVEPPAAPAPDPSRPKPEIGTWGFDAAGMNKAVAPGESFYRYANGTWLKTTQIPADKAEYGMFTVLADRSE
ncbi:MAG TPA: hypothetical protein VLM79_08015, partial [Kofleriaceae bacterium]|nr:hypothetical protein [Kofleriaceae bacterium]